MRRKLLVLSAVLLASAVVAGCTAPKPQAAQRQSPGPASAGPVLQISDWAQTNPSCDDRTDFQATVRNAGGAPAPAVQFSTTGARENFELDLGDLAAGASVEVRGSVWVTDTCGVEDRHELRLRAQAADGASATLDVVIST